MTEISEPMWQLLANIGDGRVYTGLLRSQWWCHSSLQRFAPKPVAEGTRQAVLSRGLTEYRELPGRTRVALTEAGARALRQPCPAPTRSHHKQPDEEE